MQRQSSTVQEKKLEDNYEVIVVGGGIAGLATAAYSTLAGKKVLIVEKRPEHFFKRRPQFIAMKESSKETFRQLYWKKKHKISKKAEDLYQRLNSDVMEHYNIKDIQDLLMELSNPGLLTVKYESEVTKINMKQGSVEISSPSSKPKKTSCDFLVISDGAKSKTVGLVQPPIEYKPLAPEKQRKEKKHISAYFIVEPKDEKKMTNADARMALVSDHELCGFFVAERYSIKKSAGNKMKFGIYMQVSDEQYEEFRLNPAKRIAYLKHCATHIFDEEHYAISMTKSKKEPQLAKMKDELKSFAFTLDLIKATEAGRKTDKCTLLLVGDAQETHDVYQANGGNAAITDARNAFDVIRGVMSLAEYQKKCDVRSEYESEETRKSQPTLAFYKTSVFLRKFEVTTPFVYVEQAANNSVFEEKASPTASESEAGPEPEEAEPFVFHARSKSSTLSTLSGQHFTTFQPAESQSPTAQEPSPANDDVAPTPTKKGNNNGCCSVS